MQKSIIVLVSLSICIILLFLRPFEKSVENSFYAIVKKTDCEYKTCWLYEIYSGQSLLIRQDVKPAIPGNIPFRTEKGANQVAQLVLKKLQSKTLPKITLKEMRELNAE